MSRYAPLHLPPRPNADLQVGDRVTVPGQPAWRTMIVTDARDPAIVCCQTLGGDIVHFGRRAVERIHADVASCDTLMQE